MEIILEMEITATTEIIPEMEIMAITEINSGNDNNSNAGNNGAVDKGNGSDKTNGNKSQCRWQKEQPDPGSYAGKECEDRRYRGSCSLDDHAGSFSWSRIKHRAAYKKA